MFLGGSVVKAPHRVIKRKESDEMWRFLDEQNPTLHCAGLNSGKEREEHAQLSVWRRSMAAAVKAKIETRRKRNMNTSMGFFGRAHTAVQGAMIQNTERPVGSAEPKNCDMDLPHANLNCNAIFSGNLSVVGRAIFDRLIRLDMVLRIPSPIVLGELSSSRPRSSGATEEFKGTCSRET